MFKAGELEAISMALEPQFRELEQRIMSDIVRRISINGEITRAADWQVTRLAQLGESKREIKKAIKDTLGLSTKEVNHLYKDVLRKGYERESELYKYKGRTQIPFAENHELQQLIGAVSKQTDGELKNITQSLGFAKRGADGKLEFTPVADYYQKTLDSAMLDISSGAFDYNTVLKRTVKEMTNSGLRSVDYATGHSNRIDVAARRALMTGMSQLTAKVNESNAEQLGTDMFETTAHGGARPEHQEWQGRWYTKDELESICGLGEVTGLCGANCYHDYYPVVPGISEPTYTAEQIEEFNRKENEPVEYNGKTYTKYEATQRQRKLETTMRAQRQEIKLLKEGGASEDDLIAARSRYRGTSAEYARFSKAMDLPQQRERVTVDGLGDIGQGKYTQPDDKVNSKSIDKSTQDAIIRIESMTSSAEVTTAFASLFGVEESNIRISELPLESQKSLLSAAERVFNKFPQLKGYTRSIVYVDDLDSVAASSSLKGVLKVGPKFKDYATICQDYDFDVAVGWHPDGTTADSLLVHELGHQLDGLLTTRGIYGGEITPYGIRFTSESVKKEVMDRMGFGFDKMKELRQSYIKKGYRGEDLKDYLDRERKIFIQENISEYAYGEEIGKENSKEFFAELFAEYIDSPEPRKAATIFGEILERIVGELE